MTRLGPMPRRSSCSLATCVNSTQSGRSGRMKRIILAALVAVFTLAGNAAAQQTTGNLSGRIVDAQGSAIPGVAVTGRNTQTGFVRTDVSDGEGLFRLTALPIGT